MWRIFGKSAFRKNKDASQIATRPSIYNNLEALKEKSQNSHSFAQMRCNWLKTDQTGVQ